MTDLLTQCEKWVALAAQAGAEGVAVALHLHCWRSGVGREGCDCSYSHRMKATFISSLAVT